MRILLAALSLLPLMAQEPAKPAVEAGKPAGETAAPKEPAPAQEAAKPAEGGLTGSVDFGYRFRTDVSGSFDAYRSVVDLGEGPKVFGFDLRYDSPSRKHFDKISAVGLGWGGEPYSTVRLDANKQRVYDFHVDYRNIAYFNYLPSFADPTLAINGVILNQRAYDIRRRMFDTELRFRPGTRMIPYFAYTRDWGQGSGITTFVNGASNEYPVWNRLDDKTDRYRGGVSFEFAKYHLTLEQGGTKFGDNQRTAFSGNEPGNRATPVLGQPLFLTSESQAYAITGDSIFSKGQISGTPISWLDFSGQFLYSRPRTDVNFKQLASGDFFSQQAAALFNTQQDVISAAANQPHSSADFNIDVRPARRLRILESISTDHFHTASSLLLSELTNVNAQSIQSLATDRLAVNYNRQQFEVDFDMFRWLTLRAGDRYLWGDADTTAPPITGVAFERGHLAQNVGLFGAQLRFGQKIWVNADAEIGTASRNYFRTSLYNYQKLSTRARYQAFNSLGFSANYAILDNNNPTPGVNYDFRSRQFSLGFFWNPNGARRVSFSGEYTRSSLRSNIEYIDPGFGTPLPSIYVDNAHAATALADIAPVSGKRAPHLSAGGAFFKSSGSRATSYYQPLAKVSVPVRERAQFFAEWRWYSMAETFYLHEGFRTHLLITGLRLTR